MCSSRACEERTRGPLRNDAVHQVGQRVERGEEMKSDTIRAKVRVNVPMEVRGPRDVLRNHSTEDQVVVIRKLEPLRRDVSRKRLVPDGRFRQLVGRDVDDQVVEIVITHELQAQGRVRTAADLTDRLRAPGLDQLGEARIEARPCFRPQRIAHAHGEPF